MNARFMRIGFMMLNGVKEKRHMTHLLVDLICFIIISGVKSVAPICCVIPPASWDWTDVFLK